MSIEKETHPVLPRRSFLGAVSTVAATLAGAVTLGAGSSFAVAAPLPPPRRKMERSLSFLSLHTGERLDRVYWANGSYVPGVLREIDYLLRDHRTGDVARIDRSLLDVLYRLRTRLNVREPFQIISAYRSTNTNEMLRTRGGGGVAKRSLHMEGRAIDISLKGRSLSELRKAALSLRAGGVGYYPKSKFVHVDTGDVRFW